MTLYINCIYSLLKADKYSFFSYQEQHAPTFLDGTTAPQKPKDHNDGAHSYQQINPCKQAAVYAQLLKREGKKIFQLQGTPLKNTFLPKQENYLITDKYTDVQP